MPPTNVREGPETTVLGAGGLTTDSADQRQRSLGQTIQLSELKENILLYRDTLSVCPATHPNRPKSLNDLALALQTHSRQTGEYANLDEAILLYREALVLKQVIPSTRSSLLRNLSAALHDRFELTHHPADLDEAISLHYDALSLESVPHSNKFGTLNDLALALQARFRQSGKLTDLDEAVSLHRDALSLDHMDPSVRSSLLGNLAESLHSRYDQSGDSQDSDLREAVALHREALSLRPALHPARFTSLSNLATALRTQFERTGQLSDLDEAVTLYSEALNIVKDDHTVKSSLLSNLAVALHIRFKHTGQTSDLDQAVLLHREALTLRVVSHPGRPNSLHNLASIIHEQFQQTGQIADLDEAVTLHREALGLLPAYHVERPSSLNNLAISLQTRFQQTNRRADIDEAISLHRVALSLRLELHTGRPQSLGNLAAALHLRYEETGQLTDLDETVSLHRQALALRPAPHPDRPTMLNNLAMALQTRFKHANQLPDLDEAILLHREALALRHANHKDRATSLHNLATAIRARFRLGGQLSDLDEAIALHREALVLHPATHPERSISLNNLAAALRLRFEKTGHRPDLDETILLRREALSLQQASHPDRPTSLHNLATTLHSRCYETDQISDLNEAIELCREALRLLPSDHPNTCTTLHTLGDLILGRLDVTGILDDSIEQQVTDMIEAVNAYRTAALCESAPMRERFAAARSWARISNASDAFDGSGMTAYETAIGLLPRLAAVGLDLESRQRALALDTDGLAREAAAFAIQSRKFEKAVEFLEAGRAVFWSQALQLRTPLEELDSVEPELAKKLRGISQALEHGALRDMSRSMSDSVTKVMSLEQETIRYRQLNAEWLETIKEVRKLERFRDFLLPKSFATLSAAAANGPVVIINTNELQSGCNALVMVQSSQDPIHVPLTEITLKTANELVHKLRILPDASFRQVREESDRHARKIYHSGADSEAIFRDVLGTLWGSVVLPILRALKLEKSDSPPRLWWLPTGPFTSLPIHAAGLYAEPGDECVGDYVISSYTPTLSALLDSPPDCCNAPFKMLVTVDQVRLSHTAAELRKIEQHVPAESLVRFGIPGAPANVSNVLSSLPMASIVHVACHGVQDPKNPLDSSLLLEDDHLKVSQLMPLSMPNASLVFLSACQTAMAGDELPDECMHIAATLLFSGFRGAIATMWSIKDRDGPTIADAFYRHLFATGPATSEIHSSCLSPDTTHAARALHLAVAELRNKLHAEQDRSQFLRWVPFIHFGL